MMDWPLLIAMMMFMGMVFLLLEIFVVPGFGPVGILAIAFLGIGTYLAWVKLSFLWGLGVTLASILSLFISIVILKKSGAADRFVLGKSIANKTGDDTSKRSKNGNLTHSGIRVGETGLALSDLRPSGIGEFEDKRVNVITDGIYIKRNTSVKIVRIEGNRVFVEEV